VIDVNAIAGYIAAPTAGNPAGIVYHSGDLEVTGPMTITGTLVVSNDLHIRSGESIITAVRNWPALVVGGRLVVHSNASLTVDGLAIIYSDLRISATSANSRLTVNGGLFVGRDLALSLPETSSATITADHTRTALLLWNQTGVCGKWRQAGGAFYKNIRRGP
jgi:hypothetical protein